LLDFENSRLRRQDVEAYLRPHINAVACPLDPLAAEEETELT
jgi:hypothetical protein